MPKAIKYVIFKTKWGYFGLVGTTRLSSSTVLSSLPKGSSKSEYELLRTCLPLTEREKVKCELLKNPPLVNRASSIENQASNIEFDKTLFKPLQEQIIAYFEGACVNFSRDIPIVLACPEHSRGNGFSLFAGQVLTACRDIKFGQTISYAGLAKKIGRAGAASPVRNATKGRKPQKGKISNGARAVGNALAKNPVPLIIPCHRVVRSDGKIGGFSAGGGAKLKRKMLELERKTLAKL